MCMFQCATQSALPDPEDSTRWSSSVRALPVEERHEIRKNMNKLLVLLEKSRIPNELTSSIIMYVVWWSLNMKAN